jgi:hypothetical protein
VYNWTLLTLDLNLTDFFDQYNIIIGLTEIGDFRGSNSNMCTLK